MSRTTCSQCGNLLDTSHKSWCRACLSAYANKRYHANREELKARQKAWVEANPEARAKHRRKSHLKSNFSMTHDEYIKMVLDQDGQCLICHTFMDLSGGVGGNKVAIDHDHVTNTVRGLLCQNCNMGLGKFCDNHNFLRRAAEYLVEMR